MRVISKLFSSIMSASVILVGVSNAKAESLAETAQVDQLFAKWDTATSPGCAVAILKDGRIIYERGYGMADLDHDIRITPTTVFHVASMSKQFTAMAVLMLAQEGKLSLDDPAKKYVPELPDFGVEITLRQLLHHTSGLRDQWELLTLAGWRYSLDLITDDDVLSVLSLQHVLNFVPGTKYLYSNTGFTLLAQAVRAVSGETLRAFTTARIFGPLGMLRTHFRDNHAEIVKGMAYGYIGANGSFNLSVPNFDTVGATSLLTTVEDLALWDENFYTSRVGGKILVDQMQEPGHLNDGTLIDYAAGLEIGKYRGLNIVEHDGADAGYRSDLIRFPDQHFSATALCNLASINPAERVRRIADIFLASSLGPAKPQLSAAMSPQPGGDRLQALAGTYVDQEDGDRILRVHFENGQLRAGLGVTSRGDVLEAVADTRFRNVELPTTELAFSGGGDGQPATVISYILGKEQYRYRRVTPYTPSIEQLQEFIGTYRSEEVDLPKMVTLTGSHLTIHTQKGGDFSFNPVASDLFVSGGLRLRFERNTDGNITGFIFNTERTRKFLFARTLQ